jgi:hypothetical protein
MEHLDVAHVAGYRCHALGEPGPRRIAHQRRDLVTTPEELADDKPPGPHYRHLHSDLLHG